MTTRLKLRLRVRQVPLLLALACSLVLGAGGLISAFPPARGVGPRAAYHHGHTP